MTWYQCCPFDNCISEFGFIIHRVLYQYLKIVSCIVESRITGFMQTCFQTSSSFFLQLGESQTLEHDINKPPAQVTSCRTGYIYQSGLPNDQLITHSVLCSKTRFNLSLFDLIYRFRTAICSVKLSDVVLTAFGRALAQSINPNECVCTLTSSIMFSITY